MSVVALLWALLVFPASAAWAQTGKGTAKRGLAVTLPTHAGEKLSDSAETPNVWLYVPEGQASSPFLPVGRVAAEWRGFLSVDLRGEYLFGAELNGTIEIEINDSVVLAATASASTTPLSKPVRLNKGPNRLRATFLGPPAGDAWVRLLWAEKPFLIQPIPLSALSYEAGGSEWEHAAARRLGRELFLEFRCAKCHDPALSPASVPELMMDAPTFDGIGTRRNSEWMQRWILDPRGQRPTARMPKVLHGPAAEKDAQAIALYLASSTDSASAPQVAPAGEEAIASGRNLFDSLHCAVCHHPPGETVRDHGKISLQDVREKFSAGELASYLKRPEAHYRWTRMPNFGLNDSQAAQLAAYLESKAPGSGRSAPSGRPGELARGRRLVQTSGCLNCHSHKLDNAFSAPALAQLGKWETGCFSDVPSERAPQFAFTPGERAGLRAFAEASRAALARHVPAEFAARQTRLLNCAACHGGIEGLPPLEILGAKLRPEWAKSFLAGEIAEKPRPWLAARMPAFASRAEPLAQGLALGHGLPPRSPAAPPVDLEMAQVGKRLVSDASQGGFGCVACHGVGSVRPAQVFEAEGINFAYSGSRLVAFYFARWLREPQQIDPQTKMPVYFDEDGRSALVDVLEGDGNKQIEAMWQYIRLGEKMPPPVGVTPPPAQGPSRP